MTTSRPNSNSIDSLMEEDTVSDENSTSATSSSFCITSLLGLENNYPETIRAQLINENSWKFFKEDSSEMAISSNGCYFLPKLGFKIQGLRKEGMYSCTIHMERVDQKRYIYNQGNWEPRDDLEEITWQDNRPIMDENLVKNGDFWMHNNISFDHVKLTSSVDTADMEVSAILLAPMCRYVPILTVRPFRHAHDQTWAPNFVHREPLCEFFAVTAIQNTSSFTDFLIKYIQETNNSN